MAYSLKAVEWAMRIQEVILRALSGQDKTCPVHRDDDSWSQQSRTSCETATLEDCEGRDRLFVCAPAHVCRIPRQTARQAQGETR